MSPGSSQPSKAGSAARIGARIGGHHRPSARWHGVDNLCNARGHYTDLGQGAQRLGEGILGLRHIKRLRLPENGAGALVAASAAPLSGGAAAAAPSVSARSPLHTSATSQPAASTARVRSPMVPDSACMPRSSLISSPSKPMAPRITSAVTRAEVLAGARRRWPVHDVGGHGGGQVGARAEGREVDALQLRRARPTTTGSSRWLSAGAAVPRHVLDHGEHAAGHVALGHGASERGHLLRSPPHRRGRR